MNLRSKISSISKNKILDGTVLEVKNGAASIRLSDGRRINGVTLIGGNCTSGDNVLIDYSSGQPVAYQKSKITSSDTSSNGIQKRYSSENLVPIKTHQHSNVIRIHNNVTEEYPCVSNIAVSVIESAENGDVIYLPPMTINGNFEVSIGVLVSGSGYDTIVNGDITNYGLVTNLKMGMRSTEQEHTFETGIPADWELFVDDPLNLYPDDALGSELVDNYILLTLSCYGELWPNQGAYVGLRYIPKTTIVAQEGDYIQGFYSELYNLIHQASMSAQVDYTDGSTDWWHYGWTMEPIIYLTAGKTISRISFSYGNAYIWTGHQTSTVHLDKIKYKIQGGLSPYEITNSGAGRSEVYKNDNLKEEKINNTGTFPVTEFANEGDNPFISIAGRKQNERLNIGIDDTLLTFIESINSLGLEVRAKFIKLLADGLGGVKIHSNGDVTIGTDTDDGINKLQVSGSVAISGQAKIAETTLSPLTVVSTAVVTNLNADTVDGKHASEIGVYDHGGLTGLSDDDHTQYLNETRHTAIGNNSPHHAPATIGTDANGLSISGQEISMAGATELVRGTVTLTNVSGSPDTTALKAIQAPDAPAVPEPRRIVRLGASPGHLFLPSNADVYPGGETGSGRSLSAMIIKLGGPRNILGDYGYNPAQLFVPQSWALGQADRCLDDFFVLNNGSPNLSIWSPITGCEALSYGVLTANRSWLNIQAGNTGTTNKNHAIYRAVYTETFTSASFFGARWLNSTQGATKRTGFVIMDSSMLNGGAFWLETNSANYTTLYAATYAHATEAWLSHTNAKTSNVAFTTNWTTRYTSQPIYPEYLRPTQVSIRLYSTGTIQFWIYDATGTTRTRVVSITLATPITPYYINMFVQGNEDNLSIAGFFDFIGRGALL